MRQGIPVVTIDDIRQAAERIAGKVHRTPVLTCAAVDHRAGASIFSVQAIAWNARAVIVIQRCQVICIGE